LVQRAYACYTGQLDKKPYGLAFQEVYDLQTIRPLREWQAMVDETLEELVQWGLPVG
jgi:hypothetical protein